MNIFQRFFNDTEADVIRVLVGIKTGIEVAEHDLAKALNWVAGNAPAIAAEIEGVASIAEQLDVAGNPEVALAIKAANEAVTALNAFAAASASGASTPQALVDGYVAVKQAQAASAAASAAAAAQPTKVAA